MINRVVLVGRLTKDPILRKTGSGASVVSFTVACDRRIKTEGQPTADFINCVAWNKVADLMAQYLHKGSLVGVEGRIQTRSYDNSQGQKVYVVEVICDSVQFLETRAARERAQSQPQMQQNNDNFYDMKTVELEKEFDNSFNTYDIMEDDIQF